MIITVPPTHPALPGHFPGNPLVPGVVLLDWAWQAAQAQLPDGTALAGIRSAKFLAPARAGDTLSFVVTVTPEAVQFSASIGGQLAVQGSFSVRPA